MPIKRYLVIAIMLVCVVGLGVGVYFWRKGRLPGLSSSQNPVSSETSGELAQPPLQNSAGSGSVSLPNATTQTPPDPTSPEEQERQAREAALRLAMDFTARVGSYSNADDFAAVTDVFLQVTPEVKAFLETEQKTWQKEHPLSAGTWGQSTRSLSAQIESAEPVRQAQNILVKVQTFRNLETREKITPSYQEATVSLQKQGTSWLIIRITWNDFNPS